ncbi:protein FAM3C [Myripristis murdjan]|uniref:protein FAM3C n=1 Tax=Myripristis murdjan TaxID=586833 RepID=UPI0011760F2B|nr:protein FAM3C-like [Myripristis murdjan]
MRLRGFLCIVAGIAVILLIWGVSISPSNIHDIVRQIILGIPQKVAHPTTAPKPAIKCNLSRRCPPDHFAFHIISGAADVVGPNICFEGKIIMSNLLNNVGLGLNMVLVNGENGVIEKFDYLNMKDGNPKDILAYLKAIKPGTIVLVASFDDVTPKMTNEMREIFVGLGSSLIKSVKRRDTWVFAGGGGTSKNSPFEKQAVSDEKTNIYGAWPEMVEVAGCFPRKS